MTTLREAAQQALEAMTSRDGDSWTRRFARDRAIEALEAALAEPVQEPKPVEFDHGIGADRFRVVRGAFWWHVLIGDSPTEHGKFRSRASAEKMAADLLREFRNGAFVQHEAALAEPVQKPPEFPPHDDKVHAGAIYWYVGTDGKYYSSNEVKLFMETKNKSLHYEPPKWVLDNFDLIPLYTAPPQRKPLSEEEIDELAMDEDGLPNSHLEFARAIEAKHGIGGAA